MIVIDTNIAIAYLGGDEELAATFNKAVGQGGEIVVPTIVIAEILAYPHLDATTIKQTREWLETLVVLPLDIEIAERAAELRRATKMKLIDCVVGATAMLHQASLATRDKEFSKMPRLTILAW